MYVTGGAVWRCQTHPVVARPGDLAAPGLEHFPTLFSPLTVGGRTLKNRIVHASMTTRYITDGLVSERFIHYHRNRIDGGCGAIITEPVNTASSQCSPVRLSVFDGRALEALRPLADHANANDCALIIQVQDRGRGRHEAGRVDQAYGASALPDDISWTVPHPMSADTIEQMISEMADSCRRLAEIGIAGAEIVACHGHLIHQFLSPWSNRRGDQFGGDLAGRARFLVTLFQAIRDAVPDDFMLGVKLPGQDGVPGSIDLDEAEAIARYVGDQIDPDFWTFAWGTHANTLYRHLPDAHGQPVPYASGSRRLRQTHPGIMTGALGYILDAHQAERQLTDGSADLAMIGRALITDPSWPNKFLAGRDADVRYCVSCNTCWRAIIETNVLGCDNNPRVGFAKEADWQPARDEGAVRRVTVVGNGIAGLEAAWILAEAGAQVTVIGHGEEGGGSTRLHAELPGGENLSSIYDYQMLRLQKSDAELRFGEMATLDSIIETQPEAIVLATGSTPVTPDWLDPMWREEGLITDLRSFAREFLQTPAASDGRLIVHDRDHTEMTYALAEYCADYFSEVVIVTPRERIATDVALVTRQGIYQRLHEKRVRLVTCAEPVADQTFDDGRFCFANVFNGDRDSIEEMAGVTFATSRAPNLTLLPELKKTGIPVDVIGDCYAPRSVMAATREGHAVALRLLSSPRN
ncbi:MAG: NAD(P)-binding protein [Pseudomonadota bacterium]